MRFLIENIRYLVEAMQQNIQGRVLVSFVIERDGRITNVEVVQGPDPMLNREATRLVRLMPNWQPDRKGGRTVRARFTLSVDFRLAD